MLHIYMRSKISVSRFPHLWEFASAIPSFVSVLQSLRLPLQSPTLEKTATPAAIAGHYPQHATSLCVSGQALMQTPHIPAIPITTSLSASLWQPAPSIAFA